MPHVSGLCVLNGVRWSKMPWESPWVCELRLVSIQMGSYFQESADLIIPALLTSFFHSADPCWSPQVLGSFPPTPLLHKTPLSGVINFSCAELYFCLD